MVLVSTLAAVSLAGVGCVSTPCGGVGFGSSVSVDFAALHRRHVGVLTVQMCIDGVCNEGPLQPGEGTWSNATESTTVKVRDIRVSITDSAGRRIFTGGVQATPTKVVFNPGRCDEQTGRNNAVVAGVDGTLSSVVVTPTVISVDEFPTSGP